MHSLDQARIAVIGGAGFIGSYVTELLLREQVSEVVVLDNFVRGTRGNLAAVAHDPRLTVVEGDLTDPATLHRALDGADYAFHLAALWLYECVHEPRRAVAVNAVGTYDVAEAAQKLGVRKVVYSSSASVYGNALVVPMTEEHPFNNRTMYGATKIAGEQFFRSVHEQHGLDYVGLRYMNVYGPRMDYRGVYVSVIMRMLDRLAAGERPQIHGDGTQTFDFVYVEDVARANVLALKSDATDAFYNVGMGQPTTIRELTDMILELWGTDLEAEYLPGESMFVTHRVGSTERAAEDLGFVAEVPLREGLERVIAWRRADTRAAEAAR